jgi:hypothetical protein
VILTVYEEIKGILSEGRRGEKWSLRPKQRTPEDEFKSSLQKCLGFPPLGVYEVFHLL